MNKIITVGSRGCAMAELNAEQLKKVKLNTENDIAAEHRSEKQLIAARLGKHQDSLFYDARCYVSNRNDSETVWIGLLDEALKKGIVKKAIATVLVKDKQTKLNCFVRGKWNEAQSFDQYIAIDDSLGRIETMTVQHGEKKRKGKTKNALFVREIESIKLVK